MTVKPEPPPQVEMRPGGSGLVAATGSFQLFAAQTLPAGSIETSVSIWMLPLLNTWMTSPGLVPAGCPWGLAPASSTTLRPTPSSTPMFPIQTSSLPSMLTPHGMSIAPPPVKPFGSSWVPSGRIMWATPVLLGYFIPASPMMRNCSMMDAPSGIFGRGKSKERLLTTQTFSLESSASARTLIPAWKVSTLSGLSAGNRKTVSDCELLTQTRAWESMTMSNGDLSPLTLTMRPSLMRPPGKCSNRLPGPSAIQTSPLAETPTPIKPKNFSLKGKSLSLATGRPLKSMTRILPLKPEAQTLSRVTAVPQPTPSRPMPLKPVIGGESGVPFGVNLTTPPPMLRTVPDCDPAIQFCPLQRLPSASNMNRPGESTPPPAKQRLRTKSGGDHARYGTNGALRREPSFGCG